MIFPLFSMVFVFVAKNDIDDAFFKLITALRTGVPRWDC